MWSFFTLPNSEIMNQCYSFSFEGDYLVDFAIVAGAGFHILVLSHLFPEKNSHKLFGLLFCNRSISGMAFYCILTEIER